MKTLRNRYTRYLLVMTTLLTLAGIACGGGEPAVSGHRPTTTTAASRAAGQQDYSTIAIDNTTITVRPASARPAAPAATPAPVIVKGFDRSSSDEDALARKGDAGRAMLDADQVVSLEALLAKEVSQRVATQQRIIVRTVDVTLVVADLSQSLDSIGSLAVASGGWMVSTKRDQKHQASISIRVPAEKLDDTVARLRALALKVESEISRSQDVTDEYIDTQSRVKNLQATEAQLLKIMERAAKVEDALNVQAELTKIQEQVEKNQGRLKFLDQTSAFSLINIFLKLGPQDMAVDAGEDHSVREGNPVRFRAQLLPPKGITDFTYRWDFGDGSPPVTGQRTAPAVGGGAYTTATITHVYSDRRDSPFIIIFNATGVGDAGVAEGKDTVVVTVIKVPAIEVFAGEDLTVREGESGDFNGSFTRPVGLTDFKFKWEFGDGSAPVTGSLSEGTTGVSATHAYPDPRPQFFTTTLTITASSEAGEITGASSVEVEVTEAVTWVAGWDNPASTLRNAVRTLSITGWVLIRVGIWLTIFSPLWLAAALVVWKRRSIFRKIRRS